MRDDSKEEARPLFERWLDVPQRLALRPPWPADARIAILGVFGFLRQIARSRAAGLREAGCGREAPPLRDE